MLKKNQLLLVLLCMLASMSPSLKAQSSNLYVGSNTSGNTTNFSSGTNFYSNLYVGFATNASSNTLGVSGVGTLLTNSASLYIGYSGSSNTMIISNGAVVINATGTIGNQINASNNFVQVTGANSLWTNTENIIIGNARSYNTMLISNGGTVVNSLGAIGSVTNSSNNLVQVTGTGSTWSNNNGALTIGDAGSLNTLVISNHGRVISGDVYVGSQTTSYSNTVIVTGSNSTLTALSLGGGNGDLHLGEYGSSSRLVISNGGVVKIARPLSCQCEC